MPVLRKEPFSHPDWLFELKWDGFRALAFVERGECRLVSKNGNAFKSFLSLTRALPKEVRVKSAIPDGDIVCLDEEGGASLLISCSIAESRGSTRSTFSNATAKTNGFSSSWTGSRG